MSVANGTFFNNRAVRKFCRPPASSSPGSLNGLGDGIGDIQGLRAKLGGEGAGAGALIKTVRGAGYLFAGGVEWS